MRWPWLRSGRTIEPPRAVSLKRAQLETAKEILAEIFHARPEDVEEMIRSRLEERSLAIEQRLLSEDEPWPAIFWLTH